MSKKFKSTERFLRPDHKFSEMLVTRFINRLMLRGKKLKAEKIFYDALDILGNKVKGKDPLEVFTKAVENVKPVLEVRSKRVGGATYQVPVEVSAKRRQSLAIRWIVGAAREKKGRRMAQSLAQELADAYNEEGTSIEKRDNVHAMAQANKAFAHFAW
jgi:small subunit ribosomal protein S7